jgi:TRAP-type mannitol/chloroaromatic compound transport system substrate-binding protein
MMMTRQSVPFAMIGRLMFNWLVVVGGDPKFFYLFFWGGGAFPK